MIMIYNVGRVKKQVELMLRKKRRENMKMKKIIVMMIAVAAVISLCACGGEKQITGNGGGGDTGAASGGAGGYMYETNGVKLEIDSEMSQYEDALGEPISMFESESCAIGDLDKVFTYHGFRVDTYQFDGIDYISDVIFTDDTVSTPEGAAIGDSVDRIKELYGEPTSQDDVRMVYENGDMKLVFLLDGTTVNTIEYLTKKLGE